MGCGGDVDFKDFVGDDAGAIEIVVEPEIGGEGMMGRRGHDVVFQVVARGKAEYADGLDANVLVGGGVGDGEVGLVGNAAGEDVGGATAGVGDMDRGDFDLLERTVEVEAKMRKLADAEFVVDVDAGVDFFAGVAVGFKADVGFEEPDLSWNLVRFFGWLLGAGRSCGANE